MYRALWLIVLAVFATSCQTQQVTKVPEKPIQISVRVTSMLLSPFTIISVAQPQHARVHCADKEAQKTFRDLRDLFGIIYEWRMIQPWEYYGISYVECACEGITTYRVERSSPEEITIYCDKPS
ncbi:MAG: hypothetical protein PHC53_00340 [Patescibacteria group bacterium]|nr:hypothetical protein [Patescibacteria group bacterium]